MEDIVYYASCEVDFISANLIFIAKLCPYNDCKW